MSFLFPNDNHDTSVIKINVDKLYNQLSERE